MGRTYSIPLEDYLEDIDTKHTRVGETWEREGYTEIALDFYKGARGRYRALQLRDPDQPNILRLLREIESKIERAELQVAITPPKPL